MRNECVKKSNRDSSRLVVIEYVNGSDVVLSGINVVCKAASTLTLKALSNEVLDFNAEGVG